MPSDDDVTDWPTIRTARQLVEAEIVPCSETTLKALAKTHGIGRKLGRCIVFQPAAAKFREYEALHAAKGSIDGDLKARTNAEMAEMLERLALEEPHEG